MQHIKNYFNKIEDVLAKRKSSTPAKTSKSKGLLAAPPMKEKSSKEDASLKMIADYIEGIREARQEILDGNK
jgi:ribosome-binding protein aMBF1 (putative translation factor)